MITKKVALAYSGGLDTSYCAIYLKKELGLEVHAVTINTGAFDQEEIHRIRQRAFELGVDSFACIDVSANYYNSCIRYLIFGNILKNGNYPLSVSSERVSQAIAIAEYARKIKAEYIAHGSTGAGNDQVRFDMIFNQVSPEIQILTPIRDQRLSREQEINYLRSHGIEISFEKAAYSVNKGLWGTSIGGRETITSHGYLPENAWPSQVTKNNPEELSLTFKEGELIKVNDADFEHPIEAIRYLQHIAEPFGIGRDIHVGDTIIGIKGRVGFEAAAPTLVIKAHHLLEKHVLTKWQLYWKDQLAAWYGNWMHEGQLLDPVMRDLEKFLESTQQRVSGTVFITLHPNRFTLNGIESEFDLMNSGLGTYGEMNNGWSGEDVKGFTKIFGNQVAMYRAITNETFHEI